MEVRRKSSPDPQDPGPKVPQVKLIDIKHWNSMHVKVTDETKKLLDTGSLDSSLEIKESKDEDDTLINDDLNHSTVLIDTFESQNGIQDDSNMENANEGINSLVRSAISCTSCGATFAYKQSLDRHQRNGVCTSSPKVPNNVLSTPSAFECDNCNRTFTLKHSLIRHIAKNVCGMAERQSYPCSVCDKRFPTKELLSMHSRKHERMLMCRLCYKSFTRRKSLLWHLQLMHVNYFSSNNTKSLFKCDDCGREFLHLANYEKHKTECTFKTDVAAQSQATQKVPDNLKVNPPEKTASTSQSDSDTDSCNGDNYREGHSSPEASAEASAVPQTESKIAETGGATFSTDNQVQKTTKDAPLFRCAHCDKTFNKSINLQYHMYKHTGGYPFMCKCGRKYINPQHFKRHQNKCPQADYGAAQGSDISHESINAHDFSTDDSHSSFDTQASLNYPPARPSSANVPPATNSPHDYRNEGNMEFDYLCQQAMTELDSMPPEQADGFSGIDDEAIVRNLRKTSGHLLTDALNMALEEASQFVMEQNNEVKTVGQDYNLVELAPWDRGGGGTSATQAGAHIDTSTSLNANPDTNMNAQGFVKEVGNGLYQGAPQEGMGNEISSAASLLYGNEQHGYEHNVQDAYMNQQYTDSVMRNQLQNVSMPPLNAPGNFQAQQPPQQTLWPMSSASVHQGQVATSSPGVSQGMAPISATQMVSTNGVQELERSFLEEMASIDIMPPMHNSQPHLTNGMNPLDAGNIGFMNNVGTPHAVGSIPNSSSYVSQIPVLANNYTSSASVAPFGQSNPAPMSSMDGHTMLRSQLESNMLSDNQYTAQIAMDTPGYNMPTVPLVSNVNQGMVGDTYATGVAPTENMLQGSNIPCGEVSANSPKYGSSKGNKQCPGCQQFFNHARNKYCDTCHENCAKTPKNCIKCNELFTSSNICRKFCDNCQKRPATKSEELTRICSNCNQDFRTSNSCRKYCDNCKTKPKEATTTKCATCNGDFIRSKQLRKYCATCQIKDRGEIVQRNCFQCNNKFSDSNLNRKLCYTCRKQSNHTSNAALMPPNAPQPNENSGVGRFSHLQFSSVKDILARSIMEKENPTRSIMEKENQTLMKNENKYQSDRDMFINCLKCGNTFASSDMLNKLCNNCTASASNLADNNCNSFDNARQCTSCKQVYVSKQDGKTQCDACAKLTSVKCVECLKEFLPVGTNTNRCDLCSDKDKRSKMYTKCEKCESTENEGKRLCGNCLEPKKKQNVPKKCEGCETMISHTPRKFCEVCREKNEKPQTCTVCGKVCVNYSRLRTHMVAHDDKIQHPCSFCSKVFKYKHHLKEHLATHTGVKPYKCKVCGKEFNHSGSFSGHKKRLKECGDYYLAQRGKPRQRRLNVKIVKNEKPVGMEKGSPDLEPKRLIAPASNDSATNASENAQVEDMLVSLLLIDGDNQGLKNTSPSPSRNAIEDSKDQPLTSTGNKLGQSLNKNPGKLENVKSLEVTSPKIEATVSRKEVPAELNDLKYIENTKGDNPKNKKLTGRSKIKAREQPSVMEGTKNGRPSARRKRNAKNTETDAKKQRSEDGSKERKSNKADLTGHCAKCKKQLNSSKKSAKLCDECETDEQQSRTCDQCGKTFSTRGSLLHHREKHTRMVLCDTCGKLFWNRKALIAHCTPAGEEGCTLKTPSNAAANNVVNSDGKLPRHKKASRTVMLRKQNNRRNNLRQKGSKVSKKTSASCARGSRKGSYMCNICKKDFTLLWSLKVHSRLHSDEKPFQCVCKKTFTQSSNLTQHQMRCRSIKKKQALQGKVEKCNKCDKVFLYKGSLQRHAKTCQQQNTVGEEGKPTTTRAKFSVQKVESANPKLQEETKNTSSDVENAKPVLKCENCQKVVPYKSYLIRHLKTCKKPVKEIEEDKAAHLCMQCLQEFPHKAQLRHHMRSCEGIAPNDQIAKNNSKIESNKGTWKCECGQTSDTEEQHKEHSVSCKQSKKIVTRRRSRTNSTTVQVTKTTCADGHSNCTNSMNEETACNGELPTAPGNSDRQKKVNKQDSRTFVNNRQSAKRKNNKGKTTGAEHCNNTGHRTKHRTRRSGLSSEPEIETFRGNVTGDTESNGSNSLDFDLPIDSADNGSDHGASDSEEIISSQLDRNNMDGKTMSTSCCEEDGGEMKRDCIDAVFDFDPIELPRIGDDTAMATIEKRLSIASVDANGENSNNENSSSVTVAQSGSVSKHPKYELKSESAEDDVTTIGNAVLTRKQSENIRLWINGEKTESDSNSEDGEISFKCSPAKQETPVQSLNFPCDCGHEFSRRASLTLHKKGTKCPLKAGNTAGATGGKSNESNSDVDLSLDTKPVTRIETTMPRPRRTSLPLKEMVPPQTTALRGRGRRSVGASKLDSDNSKESDTTPVDKGGQMSIADMLDSLASNDENADVAKKSKKRTRSVGNADNDGDTVVKKTRRSTTLEPVKNKDEVMEDNTKKEGKMDRRRSRNKSGKAERCNAADGVQSKADELNSSDAPGIVNTITVGEMGDNSMGSSVPKKRGRPPLKKSASDVKFPSQQLDGLSDPTSSSTESRPESLESTSSVLSVPKKKRGRPPKSKSANPNAGATIVPENTEKDSEGSTGVTNKPCKFVKVTKVPKRRRTEQFVKKSIARARANLNNKENNTDDVIKRVKCSCGGIYSQVGSVRRHQENSNCPLGVYKFVLVDRVEKPVRERKYVCSCGKAFTQSSSMQRHQKNSTCPFIPAGMFSSGASRPGRKRRSSIQVDGANDSQSEDRQTKKTGASKSPRKIKSRLNNGATETESSTTETTFSDAKTDAEVDFGSKKGFTLGVKYVCSCGQTFKFQASIRRHQKNAKCKGMQKVVKGQDPEQTSTPIKGKDKPRSDAQQKTTEEKPKEMPNSDASTQIKRKEGTRSNRFTPISQKQLPMKSATDNRTPKKSATENPSPKKSATDNHTPKKSTADNHTPKKSTADNHTPKKSTADNHTPKKSAADNHTPKKSAADNHTPKKSAADNYTLKKQKESTKAGKGTQSKANVSLSESASDETAIKKEPDSSEEFEHTPPTKAKVITTKSKKRQSSGKAEEKPPESNKNTKGAKEKAVVSNDSDFDDTPTSHSKKPSQKNKSRLSLNAKKDKEADQKKISSTSDDTSSESIDDKRRKRKKKKRHRQTGELVAYFPCPCGRKYKYKRDLHTHQKRSANCPIIARLTKPVLFKCSELKPGRQRKAAVTQSSDSDSSSNEESDDDETSDTSAESSEEAPISASASDASSDSSGDKEDGESEEDMEVSEDEDLSDFEVTKTPPPKKDTPRPKKVAGKVTKADTPNQRTPSKKESGAPKTSKKKQEKPQEVEGVPDDGPVKQAKEADNVESPTKRKRTAPDPNTCIRCKCGSRFTRVSSLNRHWRQNCNVASESDKDKIVDHIKKFLPDNRVRIRRKDNKVVSTKINSRARNLVMKAKNLAVKNATQKLAAAKKVEKAVEGKETPEIVESPDKVTKKTQNKVEKLPLQIRLKKMPKVFMRGKRKFMSGFANSSDPRGFYPCACGKEYKYRRDLQTHQRKSEACPKTAWISDTKIKAYGQDPKFVKKLLKQRDSASCPSSGAKRKRSLATVKEEASDMSDFAETFVSPKGKKVHMHKTNRNLSDERKTSETKRATLENLVTELAQRKEKITNTSDEEKLLSRASAEEMDVVYPCSCGKQFTSKGDMCKHLSRSLCDTTPYLRKMLDIGKSKENIVKVKEVSKIKGSTPDIWKEAANMIGQDLVSEFVMNDTVKLEEEVAVTYKSKFGVKRPVKRLAQQQKLFQCSCGKKFNQKSSLFAHYRRSKECRKASNETSATTEESPDPEKDVLDENLEKMSSDSDVINNSDTTVINNDSESDHILRSSIKPGAGSKFTSIRNATNIVTKNLIKKSRESAQQRRVEERMQGPYNCACGKEYTLIRALQRHQTKSRSCPKTAWKLLSATRPTRGIRLGKRSQKIPDTNTTGGSSEDEIVDRPARPPGSEGICSLECEFCGKPFLLQGNWKRHINNCKMRPKDEKEEDDVQATVSTYQELSELLTNTSQSMDESSDSDSSDDSEVAKKPYTGDKPFRCSVCGRRFADKVRYKKHKASACDKKKYACATCGTYYSSLQAVAFHELEHEELESTHPFGCPVCGLKFKSSSTLLRHRESHSRSKLPTKELRAHIVDGKIVISKAKRHLGAELDTEQAEQKSASDIKDTDPQVDNLKVQDSVPSEAVDSAETSTAEDTTDLNESMQIMQALMSDLIDECVKECGSGASELIAEEVNEKDDTVTTDLENDEKMDCDDTCGNQKTDSETSDLAVKCVDVAQVANTSSPDEVPESVEQNVLSKRDTAVRTPSPYNDLEKLFLGLPGSEEASPENIVNTVGNADETTCTIAPISDISVAQEKVDMLASESTPPTVMANGTADDQFVESCTLVENNSQDDVMLMVEFDSKSGTVSLDSSSVVKTSSGAEAMDG